MRLVAFLLSGITSTSTSTSGSIFLKIPFGARCFLNEKQLEFNKLLEGSS